MIRFHALILLLFNLVFFIPGAIFSLILRPRHWLSDLKFMSLMIWYCLVNMITGKDHIDAWLQSDPELREIAERAKRSYEDKVK